MPQQQDNVSNAHLVTLFDPNDANVKNLHDWKTVSLKHPSTGEDSDFMLLTTTTTTTTPTKHHIYELQSLETKYGSYFLGSHVLGNNNTTNNGGGGAQLLHVATRMDPMFFVLSSLGGAAASASSQNNQKKWQPLDQLNVPDMIQMTISNNKQYQHVCQVNNQLKGGDDDDDDDNMLLYKLCDKQVFQWLTRKQERVYNVMKEQALAASNKVGPAGGGAAANSAMSQGFNLLDDNQDVVPSTTTTTADVSLTTTTTTTTTTTLEQQLSSTDQTRLRQHSLQVVCEYLNPDWRTKWLQHIGETTESVLLQEENKKLPSTKRTWDEHHADNNNMNFVDSAEKKKKPDAQSVGLKRLQKVSTKGMKSMSSFFGAKKK